jgi:hypothetical protein
MQIQAVDHNDDLWAVSDVFDPDLLARLHSKDLYAYEWQKVNMQEDLLRRELTYSKEDVLHEINTQINNKENLQQLSDTLEVKVHRVNSKFWMDLEDYIITNHPDNPAVRNVIQIFLWPNDASLGTEFFHNVAESSELDEQGSWTNPSQENINDQHLRKKFDYVVNTGYIMKNRYQIHGMTTPVPKNSFRLSLYGHSST